MSSPKRSAYEIRRSARGHLALEALCLVATAGLLAACSGTSTSGPKGGGTAIGHGLPATAHSLGGGATSAGGATGARSSPAGLGTSAGQVGETVTPVAPLVVRNGTVTLTLPARHIVRAFDSISSAAAALGGFVASSSGSGAGEARGATVVVRVPSNQLGTLVREVGKLGRVDAQSETGRDVTAESVNLSARIANLKAEEGSLRKLLSRSGSIPSILQVQDQLFGVEGEIEQLSAQEALLIDQATFATLTVELRPLPVPPPHRTKRATENALVRAVELALHNSVVAARSVALAVGWAFPLIVIGLLLLGGWRLRRRTARRQPPVPSAPSVP